MDATLRKALYKTIEDSITTTALIVQLVSFDITTYNFAVELFVEVTNATADVDSFVVSIDKNNKYSVDLIKNTSGYTYKFVVSTLGAVYLKTNSISGFNDISVRKEIKYGVLNNPAIDATTSITASLVNIEINNAYTSQFQSLDIDGNLKIIGNTTLNTLDITGDLEVDNIKISGNIIASTDANGNIEIDPNGTGLVTINDDQITTISADQDLTNKTYEGLTIDSSTGILDITNLKTLAVSDNTTLANGTITLANGSILTLSNNLDVSAATTLANGTITLANGSILTLNTNLTANNLFTVSDSETTPNTTNIGSGDTIRFLSGSELLVTNANGLFTVSHDVTPITDTTAAISPDAGTTFTAIDSVTRTPKGHATKINTKTITLPTYDLSTADVASGSNIVITSSGSGDTSTISIIGDDSTTVSQLANVIKISSDINDNTITLASGNGLVGADQAFELNQATPETLTLNLGTPGTLSSGSGDAVTADSHTHAITHYALSGTTNQITITGDGMVLGEATTLSLPQNIHTLATPTFAGMTINGNLDVSGTINYISTEEIQLTDNYVYLNSNATSFATTANGGIKIKTYNASEVQSDKVIE